jgi:potassium efflux system protein
MAWLRPWPDGVRKTLRQNLLWLMPLMVFLTFLITAIETENNVEFSDSLGRLSFMAALVGISAYMAWVLRLSGEIVSTMIERRGRDWVVRLRVVLYSLLVGTPFVLAVLAAVGYYYTAVELGIRVHDTLWLGIGLIVVNALILRWLFIAKRRIVFEEAERKREEARAQETEEGPGDTGIDEEPMAFEEPEVGLAQIDEHTRTLLRTVMVFSALIGLWAIWTGALPALNFLGEVQLWSSSTEVDGVMKTLPVTLADLGIALVVAAVTVVAARSLPGVLEITLLNRVSMDPGARYAFSTICRYVISAVGIIVALSSIGIKWSGLQWLIAALGVGLGFGLQEVVANFICGLIVLFERPYRLGDVVTVGDISGRITKIRIRATTITDWDRRELIVPNKEFITGRLINWSLSDQITRIRISVGIAHGSDTDLAEKLLVKIGKENPLVLDDPEPAAFFLDFGEHSFKFDLMVYVSEMKYRLVVMHQLHQAIDREFKKAGIRISFPQRDVHLERDRHKRTRSCPRFRGGIVLISSIKPLAKLKVQALLCE